MDTSSPEETVTLSSWVGWVIQHPGFSASVNEQLAPLYRPSSFFPQPVERDIVVFLGEPGGGWFSLNVARIYAFAVSSWSCADLFWKQVVFPHSNRPNVRLWTNMRYFLSKICFLHKNHKASYMLVPQPLWQVVIIFECTSFLSSHSLSLCGSALWSNLFFNTWPGLEFFFKFYFDIVCWTTAHNRKGIHTIRGVS